MSNSFYTKDNLKLLVHILKDFMIDKYDFTLSPEEDSVSRKILFDIMVKVNTECSGKSVSLQAMNIRVLNAAKDVLVNKYDLTNKSQKPNISNLSRDKSVFGNRQMNTAAIMPEMDPYMRKNTDTKQTLMERLVLERDKEVGIDHIPVNDVSMVIKPTVETADKPDDFVKRLKQFESQRNIIIDDLEARRPKSQDEEAAIKQSIMLDRNQVNMEMHEMNNIQTHDPKSVMSLLQVNNRPLIPTENINSKFNEGKEDTVIPKNIHSRLIEKYLSVNSFDRDWEKEKSRYNYSISALAHTNSIQNRYRNINNICVTTLVIPDEIVQTNDTIKQSFNHDFTFSYPYLILKIDEFNDVYDGTNDVVRKAFCKLVFDKAYKGQNGRGYVVLKPMQNEKKYFYPAPLSSLNKLSISLLKPNGTLFNQSTDSFNTLLIEYVAPRPNFLKITCDGYFDKNEFFVGDYVLFKNYQMTKLSPVQLDVDIKTFNEYINRNEGFEILELGDANMNGFYNVFYIQAPGVFNKQLGQYQVTNNIINCLNIYNSQIITPSPNGMIMNFSLQHSISMTLELIVDDARVLDTQSTFNF